MAGPLRNPPPRFKGAASVWWNGPAGTLATAEFFDTSGPTSYTLTASAGSFTITGQSAGLVSSAWAFAGVSSSVEASSGDIALSEPAGVADGDLLLACIGYRSNAAFTAPAGWTLLEEENTGDTTENATTSIASGAIWYRVRSGSGSGTWTRTGGDVALGRMIAYRKGGGFAFDVSNSITLASGASSTSTLTGGVTTTANGALIVAMGVAARDTSGFSSVDATDPANASSATDTTTPPTAGTWIERCDTQTATGADVAMALFDGIKATAGSTGNIVFATNLTQRGAYFAVAFKAATGGGTSTLTADQGTYNLTGVAVAFDRTAYAAPGSYAQTGVAAGLRVTRKVTANVGTYSQTGISAGLVAARKVTANFGTYSLTGGLAGFDRTMAAAAGSYASTGLPAALRRVLRLAAGQGTYAQTGNDATLTYSSPIKTLVASLGTYALTGVSAGFDRSMAVAPGSYAQTGVATGLRRVYTLAAAQGTYAQTGVAAALRAVRALTAAQGTYAQTGNDAALNKLSGLRTLTADQGTYSQVGYDVTLRVIRKLASAQGTYAQTGVAAGTRRVIRLVAAQGTYAQTGVAATPRATRRLVSAQGAYAQTGVASALRAVKVLTAAKGTYTQTGVAAGMVRSRALAANVGAYALTGVAATLRRPSYGFRLDGSTYALTGFDARISKFGYGDPGYELLVPADKTVYSVQRELRLYMVQPVPREIVYSAIVTLRVDAEQLRFAMPAEKQYFTANGRGRL